MAGLRHAAEPRSAERELFERALAELEELRSEDVLRAKAGTESPSTPPAEAGRRPRLGRRLRAQPEVDERIDLHGCDRAAAGERLGAFLGELARRGSPPELVLVIHGKGERVLARAVRDALDADPRVAEHVVAPRRLGGEGARVARLRPFAGDRGRRR